MDEIAKWRSFICTFGLGDKTLNINAYVPQIGSDVQDPLKR